MTEAYTHLHEAMALSDLVEGRGHPLRLAGQELVAVLYEGRVFVFEARCPHALMSLVRAKVKEGSLVCPAHGARFELETGRSLSRFCPTGLTPYPVQIVDGRVRVDLGVFAEPL